MNKVLTTAAVFITLTTSAVADPVTDFFAGIFGGHSPPQQTTTRGKHRHARAVQVEPASDWSSYWSNHNTGGSRVVASFYGHGEHLSRHTASGAVFNPHAYTAAHRTYPFGTHLRAIRGVLMLWSTIGVRLCVVGVLICHMVLLGLLVWDRLLR